MALYEGEGILTEAGQNKILFPLPGNIKNGDPVFKIVHVHVHSPSKIMKNEMSSTGDSPSQTQISSSDEESEVDELVTHSNPNQMKKGINGILKRETEVSLLSVEESVNCKTSSTNSFDENINTKYVGYFDGQNFITRGNTWLSDR